MMSSSQGDLDFSANAQQTRKQKCHLIDRRVVDSLLEPLIDWLMAEEWMITTTDNLSSMISK